MADKEVQANSVIYSRKDYIAVLTDAQLAFAKLLALRHAQIAEWKSDTEARERDLEGLLISRYINTRYLERLATPQPHPWWKKLLGIKAVTRTDRYGSVVAYTSAIHGTDFEEYKATEIASALEMYEDRVEIMRRFAANSREFLVNEWDDLLEEVTEALNEVEYGNIEAQFIIPRTEFDKYATAALRAAIGTIEELCGKVYPNRGWYEW